MILKNIQLPSIVLADLYKYSLVDMAGTQHRYGKITVEGMDIEFLGGNEKHILVLVGSTDADYLPDSELSFLTGILAACHLSINDVAVVNLTKLPASTHQRLPDLLEAGIIIFAGSDLSILNVPFKIPLFQLQSYKEKKYVCIPPLSAIKNDPALKSKLWGALKGLFSI